MANESKSWKMVVGDYRNDDKIEPETGNVLEHARSLYLKSTGPFPPDVLDRKIVGRTVIVTVIDG